MTTTLNASTAGAGGFIATSDNSGSLALQTAGTTAITIDTAQNVGLKTTPSAWNTFTSSLQIDGSSLSGLGANNTALASNAYYNSAWKYYGTGSATLYQQNSGLHTWQYAGSGTAGNNITFVEAMRIDSSGRWMVGTATALNGGVARGSLLFNSTFEQGLFIATSVASNGQCMGFNYNTSTNVGSINITSSATSYSTSSDYRLKENITAISGALGIVAQLKPVNFKWKTDNSDGQGFIAHELQEVCPDAVTGTKDATREEQYEVTPAVKDQQGNITTPAVMGTRTVPAYQSVDTSFLVATLTAAIQELKAINDTQAETINALTARIVALEGA